MNNILPIKTSKILAVLGLLFCSVYAHAAIILSSASASTGGVSTTGNYGLNWSGDVTG
jgi:hypothetical protein